MSWLLAAALVIGLAGQASEAFAYACNNRHYLNSSDHWVHSPSFGSEPIRQDAICRDGSVSFSEHRSRTCSDHGGAEHWE